MCLNHTEKLCFSSMLEKLFLYSEKMTATSFIMIKRNLTIIDFKHILSF